MTRHEEIVVQDARSSETQAFLRISYELAEHVSKKSTDLQRETIIDAAAPLATAWATSSRGSGRHDPSEKARPANF